MVPPNFMEEPGPVGPARRNHNNSTSRGRGGMRLTQRSPLSSSAVSRQFRRRGHRVPMILPLEEDLRHVLRGLLLRELV